MSIRRVFSDEVSVLYFNVSIDIATLTYDDGSSYAPSSNLTTRPEKVICDLFASTRHLFHEKLEIK